MSNPESLGKFLDLGVPGLSVPGNGFYMSDTINGHYYVYKGTFDLDKFLGESKKDKEKYFELIFSLNNQHYALYFSGSDIINDSGIVKIEKAILTIGSSRANSSKTVYQINDFCIPVVSTLGTNQSFRYEHSYGGLRESIMVENARCALLVVSDNDLSLYLANLQS